MYYLYGLVICVYTSYMYWLVSTSFIFWLYVLVVCTGSVLVVCTSGV